MAAGGTARVGRFVGYKVGNKLQNSEKLKSLARSDNKFKRIIGRAAVDTGASIKDKTFDIRNSERFKKTKIGKALGSGITNWETAVKNKKIKHDSKKAREMKRY